jgi:hypothetical protein
MTNHKGEPILSDDELKAEFAALFPQGWAGADVLAELAPGGWAACPLVAVEHPSLEQVYADSVRISRNLADFPGRKPDAPPPPPEPTFDEIAAGYVAGAIEPERECQELVGRCLWDVLSNNHEVRVADGRKLDLGSHRSAGGFLADVINGQGGPPPSPRPEMPANLQAMFDPPADAAPAVKAMMAEMRKEMFGDGGYTYLDFYMGTGMVSDRAELTPVYEMIFRRLRDRGHDWTYSFPRLYLADLRPLKKMLDEEKGGDASEFAGYDPSAAFEEEQEDRLKDEEISEMRASLDEGHLEAVGRAQETAPPAVVRAYATVYGHLPEGWLPEA